MTTWLRAAVEDTLPLYALMRTFYERRLGPGAVDDSRIFDSIDRCCGPYPHLEGWVIREDLSVAGYAMLSRGYDPAAGVENLRIEELYVAPAFRDAGTAERFLRALPGLYPGCGTVSVADNASETIWRAMGYTRTAGLFTASCPKKE